MQILYQDIFVDPNTFNTKCYWAIRIDLSTFSIFFHDRVGFPFSDCAKIWLSRLTLNFQASVLKTTFLQVTSCGEIKATSKTHLRYSVIFLMFLILMNIATSLPMSLLPASVAGLLTGYWLWLAHRSLLYNTVWYFLLQWSQNTWLKILALGFIGCWIRERLLTSVTPFSICTMSNK